MELSIKLVLNYAYNHTQISYINVSMIKDVLVLWCGIIHDASNLSDRYDMPYSIKINNNNNNSMKRALSGK